MARPFPLTSKRPRVCVAFAILSAEAAQATRKVRRPDGIFCIVDIEKSEIGQDLLRSFNCTDTPIKHF
jgi:hypothetical protein